MKRLRGILMLIGLGIVLAISGNVLAVTGGPDDFGYTYADNGETTVTYEWIDISGMSPVSLTLGDDATSTAIDMTFPFTFYGVPYNTIYIHSNGFVKFDAEVYEFYIGDQCPLPSNDDVNGMIAFYYRDHNPAETAGGTIRYAIDTASDPDRFIVEFADVPNCCSSYTPPPDPNPITVQLVLYANNEIQVNVQDPSLAEGGDATIGVEAPGAISGLSYRGCLLTGSVVAEAAVRFYPPTSGTPVVPRTRKHWGHPGDTLTYDYTIFNVGTTDVTFAITETTSAWSPTLSATSLPVAAGTSLPFTVDVTIPAAAADGAHDVSTVTFTPDTGDPVTVTAIALVQAEATDTFWQELPDVPMAVENAAAAADGNYIFVMGGIRLDEISGTPIYEDAVHRYDVATNTWVSSEDGGIEPMPQGRANAAACGMDGKVYVVGGYGETAGEAQMAWDLYIYDVATNAWVLGPLMPSGRTDHAAVCDANNGKLYTMGGIRNTVDTTPANGELATDMIIYDVATDAWTAATGTMNYYRIYFVAGMPDDETIIVAGNDTTYPGAYRTESYSITDDAWTPLDNLTFVRQAPVAGVLDSGRFCVGAGYVPGVGFDDTYECYDNSYWIPQVSILNVGRMWSASTTHNSQIYAIAGRWLNESVDPAVAEMTASFERYPHSPIPDAQPDEAVEPVPDGAEPDAEVTPDGPTDVRPDQDAVTDVRVDDVAGEEGEEPEESGCGCEIIG